MTPTTASFSSISPKKIRVIGVPLDLGQSRRGVDMGPSAVRVAGLEARLEALGHAVEDGGNVAVAMPAFQLTLSDIQGHVLVRRVIQATELDAPATLKAHGEFDATRALHIAGVAHPDAITSYRVVAFYP